MKSTENSQNIPSIGDILATPLGIRTRNTDRLMVDGCPGKKTRPLPTKHPSQPCMDICPAGPNFLCIALKLAKHSIYSRHTQNTPGYTLTQHRQIDGGWLPRKKKTRSPQTKGNLLPACQCALLDTYSSVVHMHYNSKHIPSTIAILLGTCIGNMDRLIVGGDYRKKLELYLQSIMFENACTCGLLDQNSLCPSVPHLP